MTGEELFWELAEPLTPTGRWAAQQWWACRACG